MEAAGDEVSLIITDVEMPGMSGPEFARRIAERRPELPVLFVSGHDDVARSRRGVPPDAPFLSKPFTVAELVAATRRLLASQND